MNLFCEEVHKLEAEFKQCRKLLNAIGDENRQHLICVMMNMPIDGGLVLGIVEQTHHPGCHSLIWKRSQRSHLRKTKNLQYGDRTQNHGQYKNPYTKIWTNQTRTVLFWCLLQPVQDRIPEKCWEEGLQNPEWSWYVQFQRAAQIELWTGQKAPLDVMRKELKEIIREENEKAQTEWFCNSVTSWEINVIVNRETR